MNSGIDSLSFAEFLAGALIVYALFQRCCSTLGPIADRFWDNNLAPTLEGLLEFIKYAGSIGLGAWALWQIGKRAYQYQATHMIVTNDAWNSFITRLNEATEQTTRLEEKRSDLLDRCWQLEKDFKKVSESLKNATAAPTSVVEDAIKSVIEGKP